MPIAVLGGLAFYSWDALSPPIARLRCFDLSGAPVRSARIELFAREDAPYAPSPTAKLDELAWAEGDEMTFGPELAPARALIRISSPDHGVMFGTIEKGEMSTIQFGEPSSAAGRVFGPTGLPIAGARVLAFGGGPRGVLLFETESDDAGQFVIEGFSHKTGPGFGSIGVAHLLVRVIKPGFELTDFDWEIARAKARNDHPLDIVLKPTEPVLGRVAGPDDLELEDLELRAHSVPGATTTVAADGRFRFDHLPTLPKTPVLILPSLPEELTHARTRVRAGDRDVDIEIVPSAVVRGYVVNGVTKAPIPGASVWHDQGPHGTETARCRSDGSFEIGRLPPGLHTIQADLFVPPVIRNRRMVRPRRHATGQALVEIERGATVTDVVITVF